MSAEKLAGIYASGDDPWNFRTSAYEQAKFRATAAALPRSAYRAALEVGCGNGELARHVAPRCEDYLGVDAIDAALGAAMQAVPTARFRKLFLPGSLPEGPFDLILLSEILYFLSPEALADLAARIDGRWPGADVLCVNWLGESGNPLQGAEAFSLFAAASQRPFRRVDASTSYRIDVAEALA
ncbi:class I SAM-dependent methyltransferase [Rhodobacter sp. NSM]|uniref:class I SAM-dependent methyltransferase n=1 Tax=Rhodobacter sp. NSM TaxID=3457501 RepID=UPI003FCF0DB1